MKITMTTVSDAIDRLVYKLCLWRLTRKFGVPCGECKSVTPCEVGQFLEDMITIFSAGSNKK